MAITLNLKATDTLLLSGAGDTTCNQRYVRGFDGDISGDLKFSQYFGDNKLRIAFESTSGNLRSFSSAQNLYNYNIANNTWSVGTGIAPAPTMTRDTTTEYTVPVTGDRGITITGHVDDDINTSLIKVADQFYIGWKNGYLIIIRTVSRGGGNPNFYYILTKNTDRKGETGNVQFGDEPDEKSWNNNITITEYAEPFAPTPITASIDKTGTLLTITWDIFQAPMTGTAGLSISNVTPAVTLSGITHSGNVTTAELSRALTNADEPALSYTKGNLKDSADEELENFANMPVVNNADAKRTGFFAFF